MDFARRQLEKYGWTEGKGLGKNETGIESAIKPKLKFDNHGIGHNEGDVFTNNWWDRIYNEASNNIKVKKNKNTVEVIVKSKDSINITTKKKLKHNNIYNLEYGTFLKKSKLTQDGVIHFNANDEDETDEDTGKEKTEINSGISLLTDEELFEACGKRTAHKGARHGLNLNGKLTRLHAQELEFLSKMNEKDLSEKPKNPNENIEVSDLPPNAQITKKKKFIDDSKQRIKSRVNKDKEKETTRRKRNLTEESPSAEKAENKRRKTEEATSKATENGQHEQQSPNEKKKKRESTSSDLKPKKSKKRRK